jgi:protein-L-isoaspartate(D-aspartate) O-methyltransferase
MSVWEARKIRLIMELRQQGINDTQVLGAIERVPREAFIPEQFQDKSYDNIALPIGNGQTISQPYIVALMTQALHLDKSHKVLEIGTGSGYQTAILAKLCRRVYSIERIPELLIGAETLLQKLRVRNYTAQAGDGTKGWKAQAPFARIIVTAAAAAPLPPKALVDQLDNGGIMICPITREDRTQHLIKITRIMDQIFTEDLTPVRFVPLLPDVESASNIQLIRAAG